MLVQHGISTRLTRLANIFAALTVFLCIGLVACGGGGGGGGSTPTDVDSAGLTYVGNVNPAAITSTNATAIIDALIGGASSLEPVSNVQPQAVAQSSEKEDILSAVDALLCCDIQNL
jgi:hypothetical protein